MGFLGLRLGFINLNKRISKKRWQGELIRWLGRQRIDLLLTQEPVTSQDLLPDRLASYIPVGGSDRVFTWCRNEVARLTCVIGPFWQHINLNGVHVWNVYLDSSSTRARARQLAELNRLLQPLTTQPIIVAGDFNIAPSPEDGLYGGVPSTFNSKTDRAPLAALLDELQLADLRPNPPQQEFTVERPQRGKLVQFRCDLALVSQQLAPRVSLTYDHKVRDPDEGFTDHSALILEIEAPLLT